MISAKGLTKLYGEFVAVDHIDFEIKQGEIFAFLGPNGAGKTTTIRMLAAIFEPSAGSASIAGLDVVKEAMNVRAKVGILSENPSLYERLTARANLEFFAKLYDVETEQITPRIESLAELFDLQRRLDERVGTFSKGMKQKLAIARALIHDPPVLFLDEPTSALSPESSKAIRELLVELAKDKSRTICICTHNLFDAERLCDRVAIIREGKILAVGTPAELSSAFSGPPTIRLLLRKSTEAIREHLKEMSGVLEVEVGESKQELLITVEKHDEVTPKIVQQLVKAGGELLELEPIQASLEEAYLKLIEEEANGSQMEENSNDY